MPSVRRRPIVWAALVAVCVALVGASASGCSTTQEKAAAKQAESARILKARAERQKAKKAAKAKAKKHDQGKPKGSDKGGNK